MFTMRTYAVLALAAGTLVLALGTGFPLYFYLSYLAALVLASSFVWSFVNLLGTHATAHRTYGKLQVGEYLESRITLRSSSPLPKFSLEINDLPEMPGHDTGAVVDLPPYGQIPLVLKVPLRKRGIYSVRQPTVSSGDPFGVFRLRHRGRGDEQMVVFPYMVNIPPFSLSQGEISGDGAFQRNTPEATSSVSTVREYQPGESHRYIHWPSTARKGSLMLKQFDAGMEDVAWILVDLQRQVQAGEELENTEEYAIAAAASIARAYSAMGWSVGLMAHGDRRYVLPPQEDAPALDRLLLALTEASARGNVPIRDLLSLWQSQAASSAVSLIVITPAVDLGWIPMLESLVQRGLSATAVLVDSNSFGAAGDSRLLLSQLQRRGISTYLIRKGEDMAQALQHPRRFFVGTSAAANPSRVPAIP